MHKQLIFIVLLTTFKSQLFAIDPKYIYEGKYSATDVKKPGIDMQNEYEFLNTLQEFIEYGKKNKKQTEKEGYKFNLSKEGASIETESIYQERKDNLIRLLSSIAEKKEIKYIDFAEPKKDFGILTMLAVKNGQLREIEPVRLVFAPLGCSHIIDNIGQLSKVHLGYLVKNFIEIVKKYEIEDPEIECNFGIGSEKYVHWTLKSKKQNMKIESLKQKWRNNTLKKVLPISDSLKTKIAKLLKKQDEINPIKINKLKTSKKVKFKEEVEVVEFEIDKEIYKLKIGESYEKPLALATEKEKIKRKTQLNSTKNEDTDADRAKENKKTNGVMNNQNTSTILSKIIDNLRYYANCLLDGFYYLINFFFGK